MTDFLKEKTAEDFPLLGPVHMTTMTENALKLQRETFLFTMRSHTRKPKHMFVVIIVIIY